MKEEIKPKLEIIADKIDKIDFPTLVCFRGAEELRKSLKVDEFGYRIVVGSGHKHSRDYYIYGVLDEIEKAGTALIRYKEFLSNEKKELEGKDRKDRITRNVLTAIFDEQMLWIRKLNEIFADTLNFLSTNENDYFRHYLLLKELDAFRKLDVDFITFYKCRNENIKYSIQRLEQDIKNIEGGINLNCCWYLKSKKRKNKRELAGFKERLMLALKNSSADQKLVLGLSYENAFTKPSRSLHPDVGAPDYRVSVKEIEGNMHYMGGLAAHILLVCKKLLKVYPKGLIKQLNKVINYGKDKGIFAKRMLIKPEISKGDFVLAYGQHLGEVKEIFKSDFGYRSFKIKYLSAPPIPKITEETYTARYIKLLFKRKKLVKDTLNIINSYLPKEKIDYRFIGKSLRAGIIDLWENLGLKEHAMGRPDLAKQKMGKTIKSRQVDKVNKII